MTPDPMTIRYEYGPKRLTETDHPVTAATRLQDPDADPTDAPTRTTHLTSRWSAVVRSAGHRPAVRSRSYGAR